MTVTILSLKLSLKCPSITQNKAKYNDNTITTPKWYNPNKCKANTEPIIISLVVCFFIIA